jgi:class 3 adenylate cyclase
MLFAAAHPERTRALILQGAEVRERTDEQWPWGEATNAEFEAYARRIPERWGSGSGFRQLVPSVTDDPALPAYEAWLGKVQRNAATPASWEAFARMAFDIDVRQVVPTIHVPALLIHAVNDNVCHVGNARWLAEHLSGAKYVELPGGDHLPWFDPETTLAEIREFLTGSREAQVPDRVLATVLFTDIVGSTERLAAIGDRRWRGLLESHHAAVRAELERFRGTEIDTAGDGFLAVFDGPARAIRAGKAIIEALTRLGLAVRVGVHTGEVERLAGGQIGGIAVHIGARVAATAGPGELLVSSAVRDLVAGSGLSFEDRGAHTLKGVPEQRQLFALA